MADSWANDSALKITARKLTASNRSEANENRALINRHLDLRRSLPAEIRRVGRRGRPDRSRRAGSGPAPGSSLFISSRSGFQLHNADSWAPTAVFRVSVHDQRRG